ncbi:MAG: ribokinase [Bacteroidetes bacterium]|nr:ribokinase [Bacteroidota bacterium]
MRPKIVVVGSSNTDLVVKLPRLPQPGETIIGGTFSMASGGKGGNQAVAAARAGGDVTFIARVGDDHFGRQAIEGYKNDRVDVKSIGVSPGASSGIALIFVDEFGENCIGVASGANNEFSPSDLERASDTLTSADILLLQFEIPLPTVEAAIQTASEAGVRVILNPAPARNLDPELYKLLSVITPNEIETEILTGIHVSDDASIAYAAASLLDRGVSAVIITLGARGAFLAEAGKSEFIPAFKVIPVDTTAAGDVFSGALAVSLGENSSVSDAVRFASAAAALSVTRPGAQPSAPRRDEIEHLLRNG